MSAIYNMAPEYIHIILHQSMHLFLDKSFIISDHHKIVSLYSFVAMLIWINILNLD